MKRYLKRFQSAEYCKDEIDWYLECPQSLKKYLPEIHGYSCSNNLFIELEYIPYRTLDGIFLDSRLPHDNDWNEIINCVLGVWHAEFYKNIDRETGKGNFSNISYDVFWTKTISRLQVAARLNNEINRLLRKTEIELNDKMLKSWPYWMPRIEKKIRETSRKCHWSTIHGGLHFGNIFYDKDAAKTIFIDPRGRFGVKGTKGDAYHDLAWFLFSFHGKNSFITNDQFDLQKEGDAFRLVCNGAGVAPEAAFKHWYGAQEFSVTYKELVLLEALVCLSIIPFHDQIKQIAFFLIAIDLVSSVSEIL